MRKRPQPLGRTNEAILLDLLRYAQLSRPPRDSPLALSPHIQRIIMHQRSRNSSDRRKWAPSPDHVLWAARVEFSFKDVGGREWLEALQNGRPIGMRKQSGRPDANANEEFTGPTNVQRLNRGEPLESVLRNYPLSTLAPGGGERACSPAPRWRPLASGVYKKQQWLSRSKKLYPKLAAWMKQRNFPGRRRLHGTAEDVYQGSDVDSAFALEV